MGEVKTVFVNTKMTEEDRRKLEELTKADYLESNSAEIRKLINQAHDRVFAGRKLDRALGINDGWQPGQE